jgi:hypothetical protein
VVFNAKENLTSMTDVLNVVNARISRDWSNRGDIKAVLEALAPAYSGAYNLEVKFTKVTK